MASIASLSVKLTADPAGLVSGVDAAAKKLADFGKSIGNVVALPGKLISGIVSTPLKAIESILSPIKQLATSIPLIGGAFAAVPINGAAFSAFLVEGLERIAGLTKASDALGISTETLGALVKRSGGDLESTAKALEHFGRTLAEAQAGDKGAQSKFRFSGVDPEKLKGLSPEKALRPFLDKISALPTAGDKMAAAFQVMSHGAYILAPAFQGGAKALDELKQKMAQTGEGFSNTAGTMAQQALRSMGEIGNAIKGLQTQLAVQLAPYVKAAADSFNEVTTKGVDMGSMVMNAIEGIVTGIAKIIDFVHMVGTAWDYVKIGFDVFLQGVTTGLQKLFELAAKLPASLGGEQFQAAANFAGALTDGFADGVKGLDKDIKARALDPSASDSVHKFFDGIRTKAEATAKAMKNVGNATNSLLNVEAFDRGIKRMEALQTPLEQFREELRKINQEVQAGAYGLATWDLAAQAAAKRFSAMMPENKLPEAVISGSKEALSFQAKLTAGGYGGDTQQQMLAEIRQSRATMEKTAVNTAATTAALKSFGVASF